jgi:hypothetical protein
VATMFAPNQILKTNAADLLRDLDLTDGELLYLLDLAAEVKQSPGDYAQALAGKSIALLFEKPSLRTKLTFELAIHQLGGGSVFIEGPIGVREPLKDVARNLDRWVNGIVARVFLQTTVEGLAQWSRVPVINALSDLYHPCQALADLQTIRGTFRAAGNGTEAGVHRRWQQRGAIADVDGAATGHGFLSRLPARVHAQSRHRRAGGRARRYHRRNAERHPRYGGGVGRRGGVRFTAETRRTR